MFKSYTDIFQERAHSYHAAMSAYPDAREAEFRLVLEPLVLQAGQTLCDVPAGAGYLWRYVRDSGVRYVGAEPSDLFASLFPSDSAAIPMHCPMDALALPERTVDHLVSLAGLHHEPDLSLIFREMRRVLKPGAVAVLADVQAGSSTARFLDDFVADHNPMGHDGVFLDDGTVAFLEGAGLSVIADGIHVIPWTFANRQEMGTFLHQLFGATNASPAEVAAAAEDILGLENEGDGVSLAWPLRRLVSRAT